MIFIGPVCSCSPAACRLACNAQRTHCIRNRLCNMSQCSWAQATAWNRRSLTSWMRWWPWLASPKRTTCWRSAAAGALWPSAPCRLDSLPAEPSLTILVLPGSSLPGAVAYGRFHLGRCCIQVFCAFIDPGVCSQIMCCKDAGHGKSHTTLPQASSHTIPSGRVDSHLNAKEYPQSQECL